jgi:hypothetical protein
MTKIIKLTRGKSAVIDDRDFRRVSQFKWNAHFDGKHFYALTGRGCTARSMSRFILGLEKGDKRQADHINGNTLDNRRCNLRACTHLQNRYNRGPQKNSTTGFKGVSKQNAWGSYVAQIYKNGKRQYLGSFRDKVNAAKAYDTQARRVFGEFAKTNF